MNQPFSIVIPAIINSTSLSCPITADVDGDPLIVRVALKAQNTRAHSVIVATDHQEVINICNQYGIKAVMTSFTHNSGTERIVEIVQKLQIKHMVVNLKADEISLQEVIIEDLVNYAVTENLSVATIAHKITNVEDLSNSNIVKVVVNKNSKALYFSRGSLPFCRSGVLVNYIMGNKAPINPNFQVLRHIGVYVYSAEFLSNYPELLKSDLEVIEGLEQLSIMYNDIAIGVLAV